MRVRWKLAVVAVAGAVIGAVRVQMLQAQSTPRAYLVAEVQVTDPEAYHRTCQRQRRASLNKDVLYAV